MSAICTLEMNEVFNMGIDLTFVNNHLGMVSKYIKLIKQSNISGSDRIRLEAQLLEYREELLRVKDTGYLSLIKTKVLSRNLGELYIDIETTIAESNESVNEVINVKRGCIAKLVTWLTDLKQLRDVE